MCLTLNTLEFSTILISQEWANLSPNKANLPDDLIKFLHWHNYSWGDPANDLGQIVTCYFLLWIKSMLIDSNIDLKESIQSASISLDVIRPLMSAMIKSYVNYYPNILQQYPEFLKRVIQFAGLGLIYQLLREFQFHPQEAINHQEVYFYIAAQLLCKPEKFLLN